MTIEFSRNTLHILGVRRVQYSVFLGWSKAICIYAYFFSCAILYGKPYQWNGGSHD